MQLVQSSATPPEATPPEATPRRPLPTHHVNATTRSRLMAEHGLTEHDFDAVLVPLDKVPDAERIRVEKWAARHRGPMPTTVTLFKVKAHLLPTADLFALPTPEASGPTR